jgi:hypothetical protein
MASAKGWFRNGVLEVVRGNIDVKNSTLRARLLNSTGFDALAYQTDNTLADVQAATDECDSGKNPQVVATFTETGAHVNFGSGSEVITFTAVPSASSQKAKGILIYYSPASATRANCELLCFDTFASDVTCDGTDIQVTLNASGYGRASI